LGFVGCKVISGFREMLDCSIVVVLSLGTFFAAISSNRSSASASTRVLSPAAYSASSPSSSSGSNCVA
jgi:hypothetical protein